MTFIGGPAGIEAVSSSDEGCRRVPIKPPCTAATKERADGANSVSRARNEPACAIIWRHSTGSTLELYESKICF